jgi:hypothetical protein
MLHAGNAAAGAGLHSLELDELGAAFPRAPHAPRLDLVEPKRRRRKSKPRSSGWETAALLMRTASRGGSGLAVMVEPYSLLVMALESDAGAAPDALAAADALLSARAHKVVGQGSSLQHALELADQYIGHWLTGDTIPAPPCECGEIGGAL